MHPIKEDVDARLPLERATNVFWVHVELKKQKADTATAPKNNMKADTATAQNKNKK